ncbi:MAG: hypothetical protein ACK4UV_02915, partial [Ignavibacterium sp.]
MGAERKIKRAGQFDEKIVSAVWAKIKKKYKIKSNYILFLSPLEIRKNICRIIQSFEKVKEEIRKNHKKFSSVLQDKNLQLVLVGKPGSAIGKVKKKIKKSSYKKDIILAG